MVIILRKVSIQIFLRLIPSLSQLAIISDSSLVRPGNNEHYSFLHSFQFISLVLRYRIAPNFTAVFRDWTN